MSITNWTNREQKAEMREHAMPPSPVRNSLWMPGGSCLCVKEALSRDLLVPDGNHYFVERDPDIAVSIKRFIQSRSWRREPILHVGELSNLDLPQPLDYAFFDFLGGLDKSVAEWLHEVELTDGGSLSFTFAYGWRRNLFMERCKEVLCHTDYFYDLSVELRIDNPVILLYLANLKTVLDRYDSDSMQPIQYQDSRNSMILYRLRNFRQRRNRRSGYYNSLVQGEGDDTSSRPKSVGHTPGKRQKAQRCCQKGVEDSSQECQEVMRRANAKKRSNAAKKAWETRRRKNAQK